MRGRAMRCCVLAAAAWAGAAAQAQVSGPWGLSVYAGGNVGSASLGFSGNAGGAIVARGNLYGTSLSAAGGLYSQFATSFSGAVNGGIHAGSSVTLRGGSVAGGIWSGGSLLSSVGSTSITGGAFLTGSNQAGAHVSISGGVVTGAPYAQPLDFVSLDAFYRSASNLAASLSAGNVAILSGGELLLRSSGGGTQVFNVTAAQLAAAQSVVVDAAAGASVVVNLIGDAVTLAGNWSFVNGASSDRVLINARNAFSVDVSAVNVATILAPDAFITLNGATVHGSVIGLGIAGHGDLSGSFAEVVPEPAGLALLLVCGVISTRRRRASV